MKLKFDKRNNYIGSSEKQKKYTYWIYKYYRDINFTAFKHDWHYILMMGERNQGVRFMMKVMYDLIFLVLGCIRCLKNYRIDGAIIVIILYLILLFSTPWYLWVKRKTNYNLS